MGGGGVDFGTPGGAGLSAGVGVGGGAAVGDGAGGGEEGAGGAAGGGGAACCAVAKGTAASVPAIPAQAADRITERRKRWPGRMARSLADAAFRRNVPAQVASVESDAFGGFVGATARVD